MPGAHHSVAVRKRCIQLWLELAAMGAADPVAVATSLELEFERRVPVPNVYRWVRDEAEHGFVESIRQRGAIVRTERCSSWRLSVLSARASQLRCGSWSSKP
eukprot:SAG22_NODE_102_length_20195_cov_3.248308_15_plen_102_part_00